MKRMIVVLVLVIGVILVSFSVKGEEPKKSSKDDKQKVRALMMRKLESSQKLLEAITKNDHKGVEKYSDELVQITKEPAWKVFKTEEYDTFSSEFRRTAELLAQSAKDKNYDGASLTYIELTLSCLNCHKYMRDFK